MAISHYGIVTVVGGEVAGGDAGRRSPLSPKLSSEEVAPRQRPTLPDWAYSEVELTWAISKKFGMKQWATEETQTFGYDALAPDQRRGNGAASYNYDIPTNLTGT